MAASCCSPPKLIFFLGPCLTLLILYSECQHLKLKDEKWNFMGADNARIRDKQKKQCRNFICSCIHHQLSKFLIQPNLLIIGYITTPFLTQFPTNPGFPLSQSPLVVPRVNYMLNVRHDDHHDLIFIQTTERTDHGWRIHPTFFSLDSHETEMKEELEDSVQELADPLAGEASLWQATELMKSLISSSYSTKSFSLKWQLVRDKLQQLNSALEAAHNSEDSSENSMLARLLLSLVSTANEIHELADKCRSGLYSGGKLQMNSDLDVVASVLELHVKRLNEIYASGALALSTALVVSRPCSGARFEDVKFYLEDLITRLKVGDLEMKTRALASINEMLHEDEKHARIMAMEIADAVDVLIRALESKVRIQEEAAEAISVIAGHGSYKGILVNAGVISPLVQVAESGSEAGKERVTRALEKLTENSDNCWSVSAHGGVTVMLKILDEVGACVELIGSACGVLRNLSDVKEIKRFMVEHGLVSLLMKLLRSKEEGCQTKAMEFLHHLASQDGAIKDKVIEGGVVESLLKILNPNSLQSSKAREVALKTIQGLCFSSANSVSVTGLIQCGFLDNLLFFLRDGEISVQESVLKATFYLCGMSREVKKAMGDAGFMEELVKLLGTKSSGVQEMAAEALRSLVTIPRNQRKFIRQHQNINRVIEELFHQVEEKSVPMKHNLLSILLSLSYSYNGRRKMVETGYAKHLEKLAESGVVDAEKIFKSLSGSRFQSMLNGIWRS